MLMNDKQVYVGPFQRRGERGGGPSTFNNVYVKNLHESVLEDKLREVFEAYGALTSVVVMKDAEGKSKGFGRVTRGFFFHLQICKLKELGLCTRRGQGDPVGRRQRAAWRRGEAAEIGEAAGSGWPAGRSEHQMVVGRVVGVSGRWCEGGRCVGSGRGLQGERWDGALVLPCAVGGAGKPWSVEALDQVYCSQACLSVNVRC